MATGNVAGSREESERDLELAKEEMCSAVAGYVAAELRLSDGSGRESHAALLDDRVRRGVLSAARTGLESALRDDRSDCGAANAPACGGCGRRMRYLGRKEPGVETALGRVALALGRYSCGTCGQTVRPREAALDLAGSMTPSARRMASLAGSSCCYAEADGLLVGLAGVNYGAKCIERATRAVGDDVETRREEALSGSITVLGEAGGEAARDAAPERKSLKEGEILSVALDGTGVPARPSETAGRAGKDGAARTREAKVGALWVTAPDGAGGRRTVDGSVRYFAAVESAADDDNGDSPVARRLLRELAAAGFAPEDVGVCIGDGAAWLRRLYAEWFPNAVVIVDFFHVAAGNADARVRVGGGARPLRPRERPREAVGGAPVPAARGGPGGQGAGGAAPGRRRGERPGGGLHRRTARADALRRVSRPRVADRLGPGRGGLQDGGRPAPEVHRHALVGRRRQPGALGPLREPQRLARRLLGPAPRDRRMTTLAPTHQRFVVHPTQSAPAIQKKVLASRAVTLQIETWSWRRGVADGSSLPNHPTS